MDSISLILSTLIPGLVWSFIIWITIPHSTTSFKQFLIFFLYGILSASFVLYFNRFFPGYYSGLSETIDTDVITMTYFRIAPIEELVKILFFIVASISVTKGSHPSVYLGYGALLGLGFAVLENLEYGIEYGSDVAVMRSFTSSVLHVGCGIIFSWFFALGICTKGWSRNRMDLIFIKYSILKTIIYSIIGFISCVIIHGQYNYILMSQPHGNGIFLLFVLIASTWAMARNLQTSK